MISSRVCDRQRRRRFAPPLTKSSTRTECRPCDQGRFLGLRYISSTTVPAVAASPAFRYLTPNAPVAQLDRALPSEGRGQGFESLRARQGKPYIYCVFRKTLTATNFAGKRLPIFGVSKTRFWSPRA